jgi:hypothetical protein
VILHHQLKQLVHIGQPQLAGMMLLQRLELTRSTGAPYVVDAIYDTRVAPGIDWAVSFEV